MCACVPVHVRAFPSSVTVASAKEPAFSSWQVSNYRVSNPALAGVCLCVYTTEKRPRSDLIPSDMEPVAQRGRVLVHGTHRAAGSGLERSSLLEAQPVLLPFFSVVCISLVFSYGTLTFPFIFFPLGKISCRCPTSSRVIWMCCSLVGTLGPLCLPHRVQRSSFGLSGR